MNIITLDSTDSTNNYAKQNISVLEDKSVVRAIRQTSGRGRLSRQWVDLGKENLFISFVLKPSCEVLPLYANLTQYLSVVLAKLLEDYGVKTQIKWPNDVLIEGKKIAGILAETVIKNNSLDGIVLGIGINLNADKTSLSNIKDKEATALNLEINKEIDVDKFLSELTDRFFAEYDMFLENGFEFIKKDYLSRLAFIDTEVSIQVLNEIKSGVIKTVNDNGELILKQNNNETVLTIGDIL